MPDSPDSDKEFDLKEFAKATVYIAEEYSDARLKFAKSKLKLSGFLADAYKQNRTNSKTGVKETLAIDKAYLQLIIDNVEAKAAYHQMINEEQGYKGLEKVLEARSGYTYLNKDILKYNAMRTGGNN